MFRIACIDTRIDFLPEGPRATVHAWALLLGNVDNTEARLSMPQTGQAVVAETPAAWLLVWDEAMDWELKRVWTSTCRDCSQGRSAGQYARRIALFRDFTIERA